MRRMAQQFRRILRVGLLFGIAVAICFNVVQFRAIDEDTRHNYKALHSYETADIFEIAISRDNSARQRVAPFHYLGQLFPGSRVITPAGGISSWFPFDESVLAFARAQDISRLPYDPEELLDLEELAAHKVPTEAFAPAAGSTQRVVNERFAYFAPTEPSGTFIVVTPDGRPGRTDFFAFVDIDLIDESVRRELGLR